MSNLVFILVCLALGLALQRVEKWPKSSATTLNLYVIYVALPALILTEIPKLTFSTEALLPIVSTWSVMTVTAALVWITSRQMQWSRGVTGALMLVIPLGNTAFVGIPLIEALLGPEALPYALLYDQFGTVIALNTYGVIVAAAYSGRQSDWKTLVQKIATFPPFIAFCLALMVAISSWSFPNWWTHTTERIALSLAPVVVVAVGLQWELRLERKTIMPLAVGLGYKLLLIPAVVFALFKFLGMEGVAAQTVMLQTAMPTMISAGVLAISHGLAPRLVSALVGYGLLLSLVTVPLWNYLFVVK